MKKKDFTMSQKEYRLVGEVLSKAVMVSELSKDKEVFVDYSPHVRTMEVRIGEKWDTCSEILNHGIRTSGRKKDFVPTKFLKCRVSNYKTRNGSTTAVYYTLTMSNEFAKLSEEKYRAELEDSLYTLIETIEKVLTEE